MVHIALQTMNEIITAGSQSASILESKLLDQEQQPEVNDPAATFADRRPTPNVAKPYIDKSTFYLTNANFTPRIYSFT